MPTEERLIIFTPAEVLEAMKEFLQRKDRPMPRGKLDNLSFAPGEEPALVLDISVTGSPIAQRIAFRHAEVAAALIVYCKERSIPLPKASKSLVNHDGAPAFRICL
jgi:hypothetical protein